MDLLGERVADDGRRLVLLEVFLLGNEALKLVEIG